MTTETKHMLSEREIEARHAATMNSWEKAIREKIYASNVLTPGEWVYLVDALCTARNDADSRAPDQSERVRELEVELSLANDAMQATALRAADEITALRAALAEARKVIEPFANRADDHAPQAADSTTVHFRLHHCRAARDWCDRNPESSNAK